MLRNSRLTRKTRLRSKRPAKPGEPRYSHVRKDYLLAHPWCQITIAMAGLDERHVIALGVNVPEDVDYVWCQGVRIPRATEIHHRNKSNGPRKCDVRWFMSAARPGHDWVEENKTEARERGFLLPINATPDGCWGNGQRGLETPVFMDLQITRKDF